MKRARSRRLIDGSPNGCTPMPTRAVSGSDVAPEDLEDAEFRRSAPVGPRSRSSRGPPCWPGPPLHWRDTRSGRTAACRAPQAPVPPGRRRPARTGAGRSDCPAARRTLPSAATRHAGHRPIRDTTALGRGRFAAEGGCRQLRSVLPRRPESSTAAGSAATSEFDPGPVPRSRPRIRADSPFGPNARAARPSCRDRTAMTPLARRRQALTATSVGFETWPSAAARTRERSSVWTSARR